MGNEDRILLIRHRAAPGGETSGQSPQIIRSGEPDRILQVLQARANLLDRARPVGMENVIAVDEHQPISLALPHRPIAFLGQVGQVGLVENLHLQSPSALALADDIERPVIGVVHHHVAVHKILRGLDGEGHHVLLVPKAHDPFNAFHLSPPAVSNGVRGRPRRPLPLSERSRIGPWYSSPSHDSLGSSRSCRGARRCGAWDPARAGDDSRRAAGFRWTPHAGIPARSPRWPASCRADVPIRGSRIPPRMSHRARARASSPGPRRNPRQATRRDPRLSNQPCCHARIPG
ncbi:MAG: hypothetical protein DDT40_01356 [candidate division WS2 bacterium]|nr:hypothetical protein [Candidatus Psychracetigena formicireducens]